MRSTSGAMAVPFDLARPVALKPREEAALRAAAARAATALTGLMTEYLGMPLALSLHSVGEAPPKAVGVRGDDRAIWVVPGTSEAWDVPAWRFDCGLARGLVDAMTGTSAPPDPGLGQGLSKLGSRLLALLSEELYSAWTAIWPLPGGLPGDWRCIRPTPGLAPPVQEDGIRVSFHVAGLRPGELDVYLPLCLARLPAPSAAQPAEAPLGPVSPAVRATPVTATVTLGTWRTSLRGLLSLEAGQVIPLGTKSDAPLGMAVAGVTKLLVQPGTCHGCVSVRVLGCGAED